MRVTTTYEFTTQGDGVNLRDLRLIVEMMDQIEASDASAVSINAWNDQRDGAGAIFKIAVIKDER